MKYYTIQLTIKQKGTTNKIKLKSKQMSQRAADDLQELFIREMIYDLSHIAKEELGEALKAVKLEPKSEELAS